MGDTKKLLDFYKAAEKNGVEIRDGALERLLGQALFTGADLLAFEDPFEEYYEYGANRTLVKAFLSEISYEYLTGRLELTVEWKNRIAKEGLATQNPVLVLAILKYFSAQETLSANECEWTRFQLAECAAKGKYLAFMKDFKGKMEVPFEIENAQMLEKATFILRSIRKNFCRCVESCRMCIVLRQFFFREKRAGIAFLRAIWMYRSKPERWSAGRRIHPRNHPFTGCCRE